MKQTKFSLADVITVLTALGYGFICFLSINFYTLGDTNRSILLSLVITLLLAGAAMGAKLFKRADRNFRTAIIFEIVCLVLLAGFVTLFTYSIFSHYFIVLSKKSEIQRRLEENIRQAANMFPEYERYAANRETLYRNKLKSVITAKNINPEEYRKYGFESNTVSDDKQLENKMFTVHADLFPANYHEIRKADSTWLHNARKITESWKPIGIVSVVRDVEQNTLQWLKKLEHLSKVRENGEEASDFSYAFTFNEVKSSFTRPDDPTPGSIGFSLAAFLMMVFSYLITHRSTKSPIGKSKTPGLYDIDA